MAQKHSRDDMLTVALDLALEQGLSRLTFGRLASRLGISDRTVVYYFPTKDDLVTSVLSVVAERLQDVLVTAFTTPMSHHRALVATAWPVVARPEFDAMFGLYFEAIGQATAGIEPYRSLASNLMDGWIEWLAGYVVGDPEFKYGEAAAALALLDGLLLMRQLAGPSAANGAAIRLCSPDPTPDTRPHTR
ncbi:TetR/AcrR family transcriptional regulator [Actinomycetes bacterium M1A6_2h]